MSKHLHTFGVVIGRAKTRTTLCGLRRKESDLALNGQEADCPECRLKAKEYQQSALAMIAYARQVGALTDELERLEVTLKQGAFYKNAEILR